MVGHTFTDLGSDILLVEDLLERSLCNHIIQITDCCQFQPAGILVNVVDTDVRSGGILQLGGSNPLLESTNQLLLQKIKIVQELLFKRYRVKFSQPEACSILRYQPGQSYKRHVDNLLLSGRFQEMEQGIPTRDVSIVGYLNDDFAGGETFFDRQNVKVKPKTGSVLVFPAYYTHPHQALPVLQGRKYAFTTWLYY
jgi:predicted 2-oxoglutarate/Fe(II)-dependent dioxygenase YbiX